jgi:hypothetical protein
MRTRVSYSPTSELVELQPRVSYRHWYRVHGPIEPRRPCNRRTHSGPTLAECKSPDGFDVVPVCVINAISVPIGPCRNAIKVLMLQFAHFISLLAASHRALRTPEALRRQRTGSNLSAQAHQRLKHPLDEPARVLHHIRLELHSSG